MKASTALMILMLGTIAGFAAAEDAGILISRPVPSRSAIRTGTPSPNVTEAKTSNSASTDQIGQLTSQNAAPSSDALLSGTNGGSASLGKPSSWGGGFSNALPQSGTQSISNLMTPAAGSGGGSAGGSMNSAIQQGMAPLSNVFGR